MGSAGTAEQQRHHVIRLSELSCGLGFTVQQFLHSAFTDLKKYMYKYDIWLQMLTASTFY